jgi:hypothetical protein
MVTETEQRIHFKITNPHDSEITLVLEPWGETYSVPPGTCLDIVGQGPSGDGPELSPGEDAVVVWGWPGSVLRVFRDGAELGNPGEARPPVPGGSSVH